MSRGHGYLLAVALISFLLYHLLLVFTTVTIHSCLFATWYPVQGDYFSPFWMFLAIASLLTIVLGVRLIFGFRSYATAEKLSGSLMLVVLLVWHHNLWWMYRTFEFERGVISRADYYSEGFKIQFPSVTVAGDLKEPGACMTPTRLENQDPM